MTEEGNVDPLRVLVLAPRGRDAVLTGELLADAGFSFAICDDVHGLARAMEAGAGAALVAEEALTTAGIRVLTDVLARQPAWSDFPLLVFGLGSGMTPAAVAHASAGVLGNVTFLDRPVTVRAMLAAVQVALRGRRRQYEARRAIDSRDQFLAMMGHELRNPLGALHLAIELLRQKGREPGQLEKLAGILDRQSTHLTRLVDDLLDVARVSYGKVTLKPSDVDLNDVLRAAVQSAASAGANCTHPIALELHPLPLVVSGDRVRLEQVVGNLVTNAIKYTPHEGKITVSSARDDDHATITVTDEGIGIDPSMIRRVFDLFTQADRSLDRAQGGMGVGLTIVKSLIELHGGSVEATSEGLGRGSAFKIRIPLGATASRSIRAIDAAAHRSPSCSLRYVCVEDNVDIRLMMTELLEAAGHVVTAAIDGPQGVANILTTRPDVALVDIGLPVFDGFEVARRVRHAGASDVILIAVTGYGQPDDRRRALDAGFDQLLTKPITPEALEAAIEAARERHQSRARAS